jgi:hypothetical protein
MRIRITIKRLLLGYVFCLAFFLFLGTALNAAYYHTFSLFHPMIACDDRDQDLGTVSAAHPASCEFILRNAGGRPLVIHEVKPGCGGCVKIGSYPTEPILPGGSGVIHAMLRSERLNGNIKKGVTVFSNDPRHPAITLTLHAIVEQAASVKSTAAR